MKCALLRRMIYQAVSVLVITSIALSSTGFSTALSVYGKNLRTPLAKELGDDAISRLQHEWKYDPSQFDAYLNVGEKKDRQVRLVAFEPLNLDVGSSLRRIDDSLNYEGLLTPPQITAFLNNQRIKWIEPMHEERLSLGISNIIFT